MDAEQQALKDAQLTEKTYLDFFNTPARDIYNLFKGVTLQDGRLLTIGARVSYVYNTVKTHLGLNYIPVQTMKTSRRQISAPFPPSVSHSSNA